MAHRDAGMATSTLDIVRPKEVQSKINILYDVYM